jgi:hypothetical protein
MSDQGMGQEAGPVTSFTHEVGSTNDGGMEVSEESQIQTQDQRDAVDEAALETLLAGLDVVGADGAQETVVQDEPGSEGPPPDVPDVAPEEAAPETAQEEQPEVDDERRLAEAVIRRDGEWSAEDLALLPRERVLAIAAQREKVQSDMDRHMAELTELRKSGDKPPGERTGSENEAEAVASPKVDVAALAETLALDSDGAQVLANALQQQVAPLLQEVATLREGNVKAEGLARRVEAEFARRDLQERFPQIQDANGEGYKKVLGMMDTLTAGGKKAPTAQLMEDATLLVFADEIRAKASEADSKLRTARANGQAVTTTTDHVSKTEDPRKMTQDQRESQALDILDGGTSGDRAKRVADARRVGGSTF